MKVSTALVTTSLVGNTNPPVDPTEVHVLAEKWCKPVGARADYDEVPDHMAASDSLFGKVRKMNISSRNLIL